MTHKSDQVSEAGEARSQSQLASVSATPPVSAPFDLPRATALLTDYARIAKDNAATCVGLAAKFAPFPERPAQYRAEAKEHEDTAALFESIAARLLSAEQDRERIATLERELAGMIALHAANVVEYDRLRNAITTAIHFVATARPAS